MLDQLSSGDIDAFYSAVKLGARAKAKRLGTIRSFFRFCANRKWRGALATGLIASHRHCPIMRSMKPSVLSRRTGHSK